MGFGYGQLRFAGCLLRPLALIPLPRRRAGGARVFGGHNPAVAVPGERPKPAWKCILQLREAMRAPDDTPDAWVRPQEGHQFVQIARRGVVEYQAVPQPRVEKQRQ